MQRGVRARGISPPLAAHVLRLDIRMTTMVDDTMQTELMFDAEPHSRREAVALVIPNNGSPLTHIYRLARSMLQLEMVVVEAKDLQRRLCRDAVVSLTHPE